MILCAKLRADFPNGGPLTFPVRSKGSDFFYFFPYSDNNAIYPLPIFRRTIYAHNELWRFVFLKTTPPIKQKFLLH